MRNSSYTDIFVRSTLYLALAVAMVAMLGSLYFSEVEGYVPCVLCWYQRILMYPLVAIFIIGLLRLDSNLPYYVLSLSLLGQAVSTYHYLLQKTTLLGAPTVCRAGVSCITAYINWLGFITIPFLAMIAFFVITILSLIALTSGEPDADAHRGPPFWRVIAVVVIVGGAFFYLFQSAPTSAATLSLSETTAGDFTPVTTPGATAASAATVDDATGAPEHGEGAQLYQESCAACHGPDAQGIAGLGNSLVDSQQVQSGDTAATLALIRTGISVDDPNNQTGLAMPASGGRPDLTDEQLLAIIDHLRSQPNSTE